MAPGDNPSHADDESFISQEEVRWSQLECSFMGMSQVADNPFDMSVPIP